MRPTRRARRRKPQSHDGKDWLYVVSRMLALRLVDAEMVLRDGEAVEFDAFAPHAFDADSESVRDRIFSEAGKSAHLRGACRI